MKRKRLTKVLVGVLAVSMSLGTMMPAAASEMEQTASSQSKPRVIITNDGGN